MQIEIPGEVVAGVKSMSASSLILFFRTLRENKLSQILAASNSEELLKIKHEAQYIQELENLFNDMKAQKLSNQE